MINFGPQGKTTKGLQSLQKPAEAWSRAHGLQWLLAQWSSAPEPAKTHATDEVAAGFEFVERGTCAHGILPVEQVFGT